MRKDENWDERIIINKVRRGKEDRKKKREDFKKMKMEKDFG